MNAALGWFLAATGRRTGSMTVLADGKHVLSDFWTTVGVVTGLLLVRFTGVLWLDPLATLVGDHRVRIAFPGGMHSYYRRTESVFSNTGNHAPPPGRGS